MRSTKYIGFYGLSNTGKTTLIISVIKQLTMKGYKVASIKQTTHPYSIDTSGKDTWNFSKAGSDLVCFQSAVETSFIINQQLPFDRIMDIINNMDFYDVVLIEGSKDDFIEKIRLDQKTPLIKNTVFTFDGDINKVVLFIEQQMERKE
jgi:molybdopterin-guanine dinucleotide biosynthesis adapter protein